MGARAYFHRLSVFFLLCFGSIFLMQCSGTDTNEGKCSTNADCIDGQRCVKRVCAKVDIPNNPPVAKIEGETKVRQFATVKFNGAKSTDPDGDVPLKFAWRLVDVPSGSKAVLDGADKPEVTFSVDAAGKFSLELVVTDSKGLKGSPVIWNLEVFGKDQNEAPTANAGADQISGVGNKVELDGTASNDPEGDPLTFEWKFKSIPDGSTTQLSDPKSNKPNFTADKPGKYIVELVVNDGLEPSQPDTVSIEVLTDYALEPSLSKIDPVDGYASTTVDIKLTGNNFSDQATVLFDGSPVSANRAKFLDATSMVITLDLTKSPGEYDIKVRNPNRKESAAVKFKIKELPPPTIDKLTPNVGITGGKYEIRITGTGFIKGPTENDGSVAIFQLVPLPTTVISETELSFKLDLSQTLAGEYKIIVRNPGGRSSSEALFTVLPEADAPILNALNPPRSIEGSKIKFSVHGTGFIQGAVIMFDGKPIPSIRVRRDEVDADPELDLTNVKEGKYKVWVKNPDGKESNKEEFEVEGKDPTPQLDRILPFFLYLNQQNTLNIYGQRFRQGIKMFVGTNEISSPDLVFRSDSYLVANIDTTKGTWKAGDYQAYVINPNGKKSQDFKLTVTYLIPSISNLTPGGWNTKCDTDVEVYGNNFAKDVELKFGSLTYTTTSTTNKLTRVDEQTLKFKLEASKMSATSYNVTAENGPNAKSQPVTFTLVSASSIPKPIIREIRPAAGRADTKTSVLVYYTTSTARFELGAVVTLNGKVQKTSCNGTSYCYDLTAELDLTGLQPGEHQLRVVNPCNTVSDSVPFLVTEAPDPYISQIAPGYALVGDKTVFAVRGVDFSSNAKLFWGGKEIKATVKNDKEMITDDKIDFTGATANSSVDVYVDNGNGKKSPAVKFSVLAANATLYISSLSTHDLERGKTHNGIIVTGRGFTKTSEVYFNGTKMTTKYDSDFQLTADGFDFTSLKVGTYYVWVKEGTQESNRVPVLAKPFPPPVISYTSPSSVFAGTASTTLYIYASEFCQIATNKTTCVQNPKVLILDPQGNDVSSTFTVSSVYISSSSGWSYAYIYGTWRTDSLKEGLHKLYLQLPTGEKSNPAPLNVQPVPPPTFDYVSPSTLYAGKDESNFYIYALHFCPLSGSACSTPPIVHIYDDKNVDYGSNYTIAYTYQSSTYGYMRGALVTGNMKAGTYTLVLEHPTSKKKSSPATLVFLKTPPPDISYIYPYHAQVGTTQSYTLYGNNIASGAYLRQGLNTLPLAGTSATSRTLVFDANGKPEGPNAITLYNPNGEKSDPYTFMVAKTSGSAVVTRVSPLPMHPGKSYTLYVYGLNWTTSTTPDMLLNGSVFSFTSRYCYPTSAPPYCSYYSFSTNNMTAGKQTMQYSSGTTKSNLYDFWLSVPPAPLVTSISPTSGTQGSKVNISFSGNYFITGAFARAGTKTFPLRYSSASLVYLDTFDTTPYKKGDVIKFVVVNPDQQASNEAIFNVQ